MKHRLYIINYHRFKELVEEFAGENFVAEDCKECHELAHTVTPDDYKGSYDLALKELYIKLLK